MFKPTAFAALLAASAQARVVLHTPEILSGAPDMGVQIPDYPESYTMTGIMHIPYADVHEPVTVGMCMGHFGG